MAFPVVESVARGNHATNTNSFSVVMPATVNAGDLLIVLFSTDGNPSHSRSGALGLSFDLLFIGNNGSANKLTAWWKIADGTEGGATATFTTGANEMAAWHVYRISGTNGKPPYASIGATGTSTAPNAADCAAPWDAQDNLWLTAFGADANTADGGSFAYPTNYATNGIYDEADNSAGCGLGSSWRTNAAASEDVGAWTLNASEQWVTVTICVAPAGAPYVPTRKTVSRSSSGTINKPAGVKVGDALVAFVANFSNTNIPSRTGWDVITSGVHGSVSAAFAILVRRDNSDASSYAFTNGTEGVIVAFFSETVDTTDPWGPGSTNSGNSATITANGVTTEVDHALLMLWATWASGSPAPSGMNPIPEYSVSGGGLWSERIPSAGATGNRTASVGSGLWHGQLAAINPPATPAPPSARPTFFAQLLG